MNIYDFLIMIFVKPSLKHIHDKYIVVSIRMTSFKTSFSGSSERDNTKLVVILNRSVFCVLGRYMMLLTILEGRSKPTNSHKIIICRLTPLKMAARANSAFSYLFDPLYLAMKIRAMKWLLRFSWTSF